MFTDLGAWPMMDSAEPLHGWSLQEVSRASGAAANDVLGKLYYSLLDLIRSVHGRLGHVNISFHLCNLDAAALPQHLDVMRFDRIEVSPTHSSIVHRDKLQSHLPIGIKHRRPTSPTHHILDQKDAFLS